ncbi:hypothetical protein JG688_00008315, partial [Phytophthora aleatoria]
SKVKSSRGTTVSVTIPTEGEASKSTVKFSRATVLARRVDSSDAGNLKLGTWMQQAVHKERWTLLLRAGDGVLGI